MTVKKGLQEVYIHYEFNFVLSTFKEGQNVDHIAMPICKKF